MEDDILTRFRSGLKSINASLSEGIDTTSWLKFVVLCKRLGFESILDIPAGVMEDGVEPRELYLHYKFVLNGYSILEFTPDDFKVAVQLEMRNIIELMTNEDKLKYL